jgi:hypothetical protein
MPYADLASARCHQHAAACAAACQCLFKDIRTTHVCDYWITESVGDLAGKKIQGHGKKKKTHNKKESVGDLADGFFNCVLRVRARLRDAFVALVRI